MSLRHRILTPRQEQILIATSYGLTCGQIAARLFFSESVIEEERARIADKLDAVNSAQSVAIAYEIGLLPGLAELAQDADPFVRKLCTERNPT